jgi:hypothetical protein
MFELGITFKWFLLAFFVGMLQLAHDATAAAHGRTPEFSV